VDLLSHYWNPPIEAEKLRNLLRDALLEQRPADPVTVCQHQNRLSDDRVHDLITAYRAGRQIQELAQEYEIHRATVTALLRRHHIKLRPVGMTEREIKTAGRLYEQGWTLTKLGLKYHVDPTTVWRELRRTGVAMRSPNARQKT
jgi:hypothetical protein